MKKIAASEKIYLAVSGIKKAGRGVFAKTSIKRGELIERCPVIEVPKNDVSNLKESILINYYFYYGNNDEKLAIALGFGSIYNHSYEPNATYKKKPKEKIIDFVALKEIKRGEEITVNYNYGNPNDKSPITRFIKDVPPPADKE